MAELLESSFSKKRIAYAATAATLLTGAVVGAGVAIQEVHRSNVPVSENYVAAVPSVSSDLMRASAETEPYSIVPPSYYVGMGMVALIALTAPHVQRTNQREQ